MFFVSFILFKKKSKFDCKHLGLNFVGNLQQKIEGKNEIKKCGQRLESKLYHNRYFPIGCKCERNANSSYVLEHGSGNFVAVIFASNLLLLRIALSVRETAIRFQERPTAIGLRKLVLPCDTLFNTRSCL